jgi:phage tail sheath gpL-like
MAGNSIISQPEATITLVPALQQVGNTAQKVLIVGQMLTGTATAGELQEQIQNSNNEDALFGAGSMVAGMIRAFKKINKATRVDAIGLADAAGTPAAGTVVFTGTATAAGSFEVTIGSNANHKLTVGVASGDTPTDIGATLVAAIVADTKIPVSSVNTTGSVAITALNDGTEGNDITLRVTGSAAGVTPTVTAMASGATNPTLTGIFDVVGDSRYQTVVWPFSYTLSELKSFLDPRFNATNDILDGIGITTSTDTFANLQTAGNAENSESVQIMGFTPIDDALFKGSAMLELGNVISSEFAAIRSLRLTEDANIGNFVIATGGARDSFGGPALASFPYFNTPFANLPLIPTGKGWDATEIESLLTAGISTIGNNRAGNTTIAGEMVTTYKTDAAANPDTSFKFMNFVDTSSNVREFMFNNVKARFAQSRLTTGDVIEGRSMANEPIIRAFLQGLYETLSDVDFVLVQAGEGARKFFNDNLVITIDLDDGKVTANMQVPLVTQFREFIGTIQIAFSTEG